MAVGAIVTALAAVGTAVDQRRQAAKAKSKERKIAAFKEREKQKEEERTRILGRQAQIAADPSANTGKLGEPLTQQGRLSV